MRGSGHPRGLDSAKSYRAGVAPGVVLDIVGLVKNEDSLVDVHVHGLADDRVYQVVVGTEYQVRVSCKFT